MFFLSIPLLLFPPYLDGDLSAAVNPIGVAQSPSIVLTYLPTYTIPLLSHHTPSRVRVTQPHNRVTTRSPMRSRRIWLPLFASDRAAQRPGSSPELVTRYQSDRSFRKGYVAANGNFIGKTKGTAKNMAQSTFRGHEELNRTTVRFMRRDVRYGLSHLRSFFELSPFPRHRNSPESS